MMYDSHGEYKNYELPANFCDIVNHWLDSETQIREARKLREHGQDFTKYTQQLMTEFPDITEQDAQQLLREERRLI